VKNFHQWLSENHFPKSLYTINGRNHSVPEIAAWAKNNLKPVALKISDIQKKYEDAKGLFVDAEGEWVTRSMNADLSFPILVLEKPDGKWEIIDGNHRVWKAWKNNMTTIDAYLIKDFAGIKKFNEWLELNEMAWELSDKSRNQYRNWKEAAKNNSEFLRNVDWKEVLVGLKSKPALHQRYMELSAEEQNGWTEDEWAAKKYIRDNTGILLAKVNPCEFMKTRSIRITNPDPSWYKSQLSTRDYDPGLPLAMVSSKGVLLYDGNHRMQAACELGQPAYVVIAYFMDYNSVKHTVTDILEDN
jgi:hypothetical protein